MAARIRWRRKGAGLRAPAEACTITGLRVCVAASIPRAHLLRLFTLKAGDAVAVPAAWSSTVSHADERHRDSPRAGVVRFGGARASRTPRPGQADLQFNAGAR